MATSKIFNLIGKIVCYILFALGAFMGIMMIVKSRAIASDVAVGNQWVLPAVYISEVAVILAIIIALLFPLFFTHHTKQGIIKAVIFIVAAIAVIAIAYLLPDAQLSEEFMSNPDLNVNPTISKWVGTGCYLAYFLTAGAIIVIIYGAISDLLKKGNV